MRSDISKVLVERPRVGGEGKKHIRQNRRDTKQNLRNASKDEDVDVWSFHSMKRLHTSTPGSYDDRKQLNENLNPLYRFLNKQVGRKWDDVYSEIMSNLNLNNAVQYHVWQHLIAHGIVETRTWIENDKIMQHGYFGPEEVQSSYRVTYYVDPSDGVLRKYDREPRYRTKKKVHTDRFYDKKNPLEYYHKLNGIWYKFGLRKPTADELVKQQFGKFERYYNPYQRCWVKEWFADGCKFLQQIHSEPMDFSKNVRYFNSPWELSHRYFGCKMLPITKQQLGKKEIKRLEAEIQKQIDEK
jgi:hypothetical protein